MTGLAAVPSQEPSAGAVGHSGPTTWSRLGLVCLGAVGTILALDLALKMVLGAPVRLSEVSDGVGAFAAENPDVLVIGSSHARSFDSVAAALSRRTDGKAVMVAVPLEGGKLSGYFWVLRNRLAPLLEARAPDGTALHSRLRHVVLVTEWWDSCSYDDGGLNIPGRGWVFGDFLSDVGRNGVTPFNRSYVASRWARDLASVGLVRNRIIAWIPGAIRLRFYPPARREAYFAGQTENWQGMVDHGAQCIGAPEQMAALDSTLTYLAERQIQTTILLYPRKPGTLTAAGKANTLAPYAAMMREHATRFPGVTVIDLSDSSPLGDDDFGADFDHVTPGANSRFATFVLDGPLAFLTGHAQEFSLP